jgi:hypothetical protein
MSAEASIKSSVTDIFDMSTGCQWHCRWHVNKCLPRKSRHWQTCRYLTDIFENGVFGDEYEAE